MPTLFQTQQNPVVFTPTNGAGTEWPNSSVQVNIHAAGAASIFSDPGLSVPLANPIRPAADGYVRFYVAAGSYDLVATNFDGTTQTFTILVANPGLPGLTKRASTGIPGFTLVNGTPVILTYTAPADGQMHPYIVGGQVTVTSTQTGGSIGLTMANPTVTATTSDAGGHGAGTFVLGNNSPGIGGGFLQPGQTINIQQTAALTVGAATVIVEIWSA